MTMFATELLVAEIRNAGADGAGVVALLGFVAILFQINEIRANNRARARGRRFGLHRFGVKTRSFPYPDYDAIKASTVTSARSMRASSRTSSTPARRRSTPSPTSANGKLCDTI